jgi:hypothetical protein
MFDDPRSGFDRRTKRRGMVGQVGDKRQSSDRRVFREPRQSKPWWLMRCYVNAEKLLGGPRFK